MNYETDIISIVSKLQVNHELKTAQSLNEIVINPLLIACTLDCSQSSIFP